VQHTSVAVAVAFAWLGMVVAISFVEAPLKFRAPGVTVPIGLAIGRIVFRALNVVETVLAIALLLAIVLGDAPVPVLAVTGIVVVVMVAQLGVVRPRLNRRSDRVLAGEQVPRSHAHLGYVALEAAKVVALLVLGILVLSSRAV
jgi:hypothetical protein